MLELFRTPRIDFMRLRGYAYAFSALIVLASFAGLIYQRSTSTTGDSLNYGIDFRGGTLMQVRFAAPPDVTVLRSQLSAAGFGAASIQHYGKSEENSILIRVGEQLEESSDLESRIRGALRQPEELAREKQGLLDLNTAGEARIAELLEQEVTGQVEKSPEPVYLKVARGILHVRGLQPGGLFAGLDAVKGVEEMTAAMTAAIEKRCYAGSLSVQRTESVGPAVGKDLRTKAMVASLMANAMILVYLWFRFELRFGVAAVICLMHDVIFILGVFAFTGREFDLTVLAAILTVIGYSVNDTIVIFDRIRTNLKLMRKEPIESILNTSINQTLSRTVLTSGLTLVVVVALYLYGGEVLNGFAFALLIGIVEGTYSTIFVATPLLLVWRRLFDQKKA